MYARYLQKALSQAAMTCTQRLNGEREEESSFRRLDSLEFYI